MDEILSSQLDITNAALSKHFLNAEVLRRHCILDHGLSHYDRPTTENALGLFEKLPSEITEQVLENMDIKSLCIFRRTCSRAMAAVDALPAFRKIKTHAPDVLRMAISIRTTHLYTITALFAKLCQTTCDICNKPAPYIDLLKLRRDCFGVGVTTPEPNQMNVGTSSSPCLASPAPRLFFEVVQDTGLSPPEIVSLPSFRALPGLYGNHHLSSAKVFYDEEAAASHPKARSGEKANTLDITRQVLATGRIRSRYCSVLAPFLAPTSERSESLSFCPVGRKYMMKRYQGTFRIGRYHNLARSKGDWAYIICEEFMDFPLYWRDELVQHLREKHSKELAEE